jgi:hypothetical protein
VVVWNRTAPLRAVASTVYAHVVVRLANTATATQGMPV